MPRKKYLSDADVAILRGMAVLYVEDEPTTREIFSDMLTRIVGRVHTAEDGEAGLAAFREYAPDMVISDIQMPCMNGLDMAAAIKRLSPRTPIIITTAFNDNDLLLKAISAGIDKFLLKPVDKHALDEALIQCARPLDTEKRLRESEQQFRHITENIGDLVALLDTQGRRLYNSPSYRAIFGEIPPLGSNSFDDVHPEDRERIRALFAETVRSGQGRRAQYRLLLKNGAVRYVESSTGVVRDEQGAVSHVVMVAHDVTERHEMEKTILEIDEKVRMAIGQELHDDLGQQLTGIGFVAKALESRLAAQFLPESCDAARIVQGVTNAINQTRALSKGLYPVELEESGLPPALDQLAAYVRDTFGVASSFSCSCAVPLPGGVAIHLYRIAQEAVSNAVRHGNASRIEISLSSWSDGMSLRIANNGAPLETAGMPDSSGMGLRIMKYRADLIGAQLEFCGAPHGGMTVGVTFSNPVC
jgi:PAS domain S-box-containing protein